MQIAVAVGYVAMMSLIVNAFEVPPVGDGTKPAL